MAATQRAARAPSARKKAPSPQEVAPGVFLGGWKDAVKFTGRKFCVLDQAPEDMPTVTHVPIFDEEKDAPIVANLDRLATEISAARASGDSVLVFCGHGVRRSPLAVAWYLHREQKLPLVMAYNRIRAIRPRIELPSEWIGDCAPLEG
jgi:protein-tyrosine phosphatase